MNKSSTEIVQRANLYLKSGHYQACEKMIKKAIRSQKPHDDQLFTLLAVCLLKQSKVEDSIFTVMNYIEKNGHSNEASLCAAALLSDIGQYRHAEELMRASESNSLSKTRLANKRRSAAYKKCGLISSALSTLSEAEEMFKKAVSYDPDSEENLLNLGKTYYKQKNYAKAKEIFGNLLLLNPNNQEGLYWQGCAHSKLDKRVDAEYYWKKAIENDPDHSLSKVISDYLGHL